jgi:hypothetical protein
MLIREEVNRDQIKIFRKMDLKNHEDIILSSEFIEGKRSNFKNLTCDACIIYIERNKLL